MLSRTAHQSIVTRTAAAREQAEALLRGLVEAKSASERRLAELRQIDPLKHATGRSSFDNAIASTRRMIDMLDRSVSQLRRAPHEAEVVVVAGLTDFSAASAR